MSLIDWHKNGWLKLHTPTQREIADLLALADRDIRNAKIKALDADWRFSIAYNAALQAATAALVACGYNVPKGDSHHFRVIGSLAFSVALDPKLIDKLDRYRKKRSMTIYDFAGAITAGEADDMLVVARDIIKCVRAWVVQTHPTLVGNSK